MTGVAAGDDLDLALGILDEAVLWRVCEIFWSKNSEGKIVGRCQEKEHKIRNDWEAFFQEARKRNGVDMTSRLD